MRLPFAINSYRHRSLPVSAQRLVNWLPEAQPADAKARVVLLPSPGLVLFATLPQGPVRAMHVMGATLYAVGGGALYRVTSAGAVTFVGNIDGHGAVSMADNGTQVIVVEPVSRKAWVATETTFQQITSPDFDTPVCVAVVDGYAAFAKADSNQFFLSEIRDALTYDALDFASAESAPDNIIGHIVDHREIWLGGQVGFRSALQPRRRLDQTEVQHLDLVLNRIQPVPTKSQQGSPALIAGKHLLQRQLTCLDAAHELLQLFQRRFVAGRFGGRSRGCRGLGHGGGGSARVKNR